MSRNLSDDVARLTAVVVAALVADGVPTRMRSMAKLNFSDVAKVAGTTPAAVQAWERGVLRPSTGEALAWLGFLLDRQPSSYSAAVAADVVGDRGVG